MKKNVKTYMKSIMSHIVIGRKIGDIKKYPFSVVIYALLYNPNLVFFFR